MLKYAIKRILLIIPTLLAVLFFIFILLSLTPVNPGRIKYGPDASEEDVQKFNEEVGYVGSPVIRYINYVINLVQGDFGLSYISRKSVIEEVATRWPVTIKLATMSLILAALIGVPLGVLCAVKLNSVTDRVLTAISIFLASMPVFLSGVLLLLLFVSALGWANIITDDPNSFSALILPTLSLGIPYSAGFMRYTRGAMLDVIRSDYIRTARAKGCAEKSVVFKHAFKNASLTVITITGINMGALLGSTVITERLFSLNGIGKYGLNALLKIDVPQIMATVTIFCTIFVLIMLIVDFAYAWIDPRIRARYKVK